MYCGIGRSWMILICYDEEGVGKGRGGYWDEVGCSR